MASTEKIGRIIQLIDLLQSGREYTVGQLCAVVGAARRTLFRDLEELKKCGIQVAYNRGARTYQVSRPSFLPPADLTVEETLALILLCESTAPGKWHAAVARALGSSSHKLHANLPARLQAEIGELAEAVEDTGDCTQSAIGREEHYERVLEAVRLRRKLRIVYDSIAEREQISTLLSPFRLFFHKRAWYVVGRSTLHRAPRTFHVGRIISSTLTDDVFTPPPRFSLDKFFGKAWKIIRRKGETRTVRIRFQPLVARNVADVIWHKTQRISWNADGSLDFRVTVEGLDEMSWWVLGYGDQAEVLDPPEFRDLLRGKAKRMSQMYGRGTPAAAARPTGGTRRPVAASKPVVPEGSGLTAAPVRPRTRRPG